MFEGGKVNIYVDLVVLQLVKVQVDVGKDEVVLVIFCVISVDVEFKLVIDQCVVCLLVVIGKSDEVIKLLGSVVDSVSLEIYGDVLMVQGKCDVVCEQYEKVFKMLDVVVLQWCLLEIKVMDVGGIVIDFVELV